MSEAELADNREAITEAATTLFSRHGYSSVTMRSIARELGWSPMATYRYFPSKAAIFTAVREQALAQLAEAMRAAGKKTDEVQDRLRRQSMAYVEFGLARPHEYALAFEYFAPDMPGFPLLTEPSLMSWQLQLDLIEALCNSGQLAGDPVEINHLIWCALHGVVTLQNAQRLIFGVNAEVLAESAIETVLHRFTP